jgi:hypothetical protein
MLSSWVLHPTHFEPFVKLPNTTVELAIQIKMQSTACSYPSTLPIIASQTAILSNTSCETAKYLGQLSNTHYDAV